MIRRILLGAAIGAGLGSVALLIATGDTAWYLMLIVVALLVFISIGARDD